MNIRSSFEIAEILTWTLEARRKSKQKEVKAQMLA